MWPTGKLICKDHCIMNMGYSHSCVKACTRALWFIESMYLWWETWTRTLHDSIGDSRPYLLNNFISYVCWEHKCPQTKSDFFWRRVIRFWASAICRHEHLLTSSLCRSNGLLCCISIHWVCQSYMSTFTVMCGLDLHSHPAVILPSREEHIMLSSELGKESCNKSVPRVWDISCPIRD